MTKYVYYVAGLPSWTEAKKKAAIAAAKQEIKDADFLSPGDKIMYLLGGDYPSIQVIKDD